MIPRLSVVMACHNAEEYLGEAIESLLSQTYRDFELIVVDDASSDSSVQIVLQYAKRDERVRFLPLEENVGPAIVRNTAIDVAQGEWLAILDADDVAFPERLERQMAYVDRHPETVLLGSGFVEINAKGQDVWRHVYPRRHDRLLRRIQRTGCFPPHSSCLYHKATVDKCGRFNPRFRRSQDADLWFRLLLAGTIAVLPMPLVRIRKHEKNISDDAGGRMQALFGTAARACHSLRVRGAADPSSQTDADWDRFLEWLELRVEEEQLFERRQEWQRLRRQYFSSSNKVIGIWRLLKSLTSLQAVLHVIERRRFCSDLAAKLADEWIIASLPQVPVG